MKIVLLSNRLSFVRLASGKIHARDAQWNHATLHPVTMCGKEIAEGTQPLPENAVSPADTCKRCTTILRTYTGGAKRLYATPLVRFEKDEVSV